MLFEHFNYFKPTLFELFLITLFFQPVITRKVRKTKINVTFYLFVRIIFNYLIFFQKKKTRDKTSIILFSIIIQFSFFPSMAKRIFSGRKEDEKTKRDDETTARF